MQTFSLCYFARLTAHSLVLVRCIGTGELWQIKWWIDEYSLSPYSSRLCLVKTFVVKWHSVSIITWYMTAPYLRSLHYLLITCYVFPVRVPVCHSLYPVVISIRANCSCACVHSFDQRHSQAYHCTWLCTYVCTQVEVIPRYSPDAPRGTVLNPTGITLPPVMRQYVEAIVDKQWSTWRRKGCVGCTVRVYLVWQCVEFDCLCVYMWVWLWWCVQLWLWVCVKCECDC